MYFKLGNVAIDVQKSKSFVFFDFWAENGGKDYIVKFLKMEVVVSLLRKEK